MCVEGYVCVDMCVCVGNTTPQHYALVASPLENRANKPIPCLARLHQHMQAAEPLHSLLHQYHSVLHQRLVYLPVQCHLPVQFEYSVYLPV